MSRRHKLSYLSDMPRHTRNVAYYARGALLWMKPYRVCMQQTQNQLMALEHRPDLDEIEERVAYYNKLAEPFDASDARLVSQMEIGQSRYYFDLMEHAKGFGPDRHLRYQFGDITKVPQEPAIVKSRPISNDNANSVLINLDKHRHFRWEPDPLPFRDKKPMAVWRGTPHTDARRRLVERFYDHPNFDVGHTGSMVGPRPPKNVMSFKEQKQFKFFISLEGNDVATNLKWSMASNMLVMSPKLRFETWFMEGRLRPNEHFVLLKDDFSDLEEKVEQYSLYPAAAEEIIERAHRWIGQFKDPAKERIIGARVLEKYFTLSGQM